MRIDGYVSRLLNKNIETKEDILKNNKYIHKISNRCKSTKLFKDNIQKFKNFKKDLKTEYNKNDLLMASFIHFLLKIVDAPTSIHRRFSVILTIPVISDFIKEIREEN